MGKVITVTSGKGGVGKSTVTANISHFFAFKGKKTLVIDLDIGLRTLDFILGVSSSNIHSNIIEIMEGKIDYKDCLIKVPKNDNLYFIAASDDYDKQKLNIEKFQKVINELKKEWDYIIIDSPAGIENGFINSIFVADELIITVTPDNFSVNDANKVINLIEKHTENNSTYFIVNKYIDSFAKNGDMYDINEMKKKLGVPLLGVVQFDEKIIQSTDMGIPISLYKNTKGGEEFRNIVKRLLGEDVPLPKFSILDKLKLFFKLKG